MDDKNVCPKCGQIYETALDKCPLCGAPSPKLSAPEQPTEEPVSRKGGKYLSREDKKALQREEEAFLREEEGRYRRMKRRGDADVPEGEPDPHIPAGFIVASVLILLAALVIGGSFLLWKSNLIKSGLYDRLAGRNTEPTSLTQPDTLPQTEAPVVTEPSADTEQTDAPVTEDTTPTLPYELPAFDPDLVVLVNDTHPLPSDYAVGELIKLRGGAQVSTRCLDDLQEMFDACRADHHYPDAFFGFDEFAPETSEYRTGLAFDVFPDTDPTRDVAKMRESETLIWLWEHCHEYGFIVRCPEGKEELTGHDFEPWHFRYVGKSVSEFLNENDLCLEEFDELLKLSGQQ